MERDDVDEELEKDIKDFTILESDSENTISLKFRNLIKLSQSYIFSFKCESLSKTKRNLIHSSVGDSFFHFTIKGILYLSNREEHKNLFNKYSKLSATEKKLDDKMSSLNSKLSSMSLSDVKKNSLQLEKLSLQPLKISTSAKNEAKQLLDTINKNAQCPICLTNGVPKLIYAL